MDKDDWRPSLRIDRVMRGEVDLLMEDQGIRSVCGAQIISVAQFILRMNGKKQRRAALAKIPPLVRVHVEAEIMRLWKKDPRPSE
jgi:hypothetical protein